MTTLESGSTLSREIAIEGLEKKCQVEITFQGISFWIKGNRKKVVVTWKQIILAGRTGTDVPSFLMDKPLEMLQYQCTKAKKMTY